MKFNRLYYGADVKMDHGYSVDLTCNNVFKRGAKKATYSPTQRKSVLHFFNGKSLAMGINREKTGFIPA